MKKLFLFNLLIIFFIGCGDDSKEMVEQNLSVPPNDVPIGINENKPNIDIQNPPEPVPEQ